MPEWLHGEPSRNESRFEVAAIVKKFLALCICVILMPPFWLAYLPLRLIRGKPPCVPSFRQWRRYFMQALIGKASPPGIRLSVRVRLLLELLRAGLCVPLGGLAWFLDDILYARQLRQVTIEKPLFELSAMRSGSTQLGRYLEADEHIITPSLLQSMFPYLWLWKLCSLTLGRVLSRQWVRQKFIASLPVAFVQRHEIDPFATDTLDIPFFTLHLNIYARAAGADFLRDDFAFGRVVAHNRHLWEEDFVAYVDGLARKTLLFAQAPVGHHLLIKGHFLAAAEALQRHFPDACFLTVIREPLQRIRSGINFVALAPDPVKLGMPPWAWCVQGVVEAELEYCEREMAWYQRDDIRHCVIRFSDYTRDLPGTMRKVYRECLDRVQLPATVPAVHAARERRNYLVDRSLPELGVDEVALAQRLQAYSAWCQGGQ